MKSGSILLFHNDLENTTQALPDILTQLRDSGYEFVTVSELIYHDDYTINSDGMQVPQVKAGLDINADNVDEVMAEYEDEIKAAGFTDEQMQMAAQAIRSGAEIPEDVMAVIAQLGVEVPVSVDGILESAKDGRAAVDTGTPSGNTGSGAASGSTNGNTKGGANGTTGGSNNAVKGGTVSGGTNGTTTGGNNGNTTGGANGNTTGGANGTTSGGNNGNTTGGTNGTTSGGNNGNTSGSTNGTTTGATGMTGA